MYLLILSIIFLFIFLTTLVLYVLYYLYWKPKVQGKSCNVTKDCQVNQTCISGVCRENTCNTNDDCNNTSKCINSYCESYRCISSNDCTNIFAACVNNICTEVGTTCQSNFDCYGLSCVNNICVQCTTNSNCEVGQACFNNICRYPNIDEVSLNTFTFPSPSFERGDITAPKAYSCNKDGCNNDGEIIECNDEFPQLCPSACPFCVNSVCRCTSGKIFEQCRVNADCLSGTCNSSTNICVEVGNECANNAGGDYLPCPSNLPYCVNGKCSGNSFGAICSQDNICPEFFCVNGKCGNLSGELNQLCVEDSCTTYNNNTLTCNDGRCK